MSTIILRGGVEVGNPLEVALEFLAAYPDRETHGSGLASFDESDLRLANRGGARISAAEIAAILERRGEIERALSKIRIEASLADATRSIPWIPLTQLFHAFADIRQRRRGTLRRRSFGDGGGLRFDGRRFNFRGCRFDFNRRRFDWRRLHLQRLDLQSLRARFGRFNFCRLVLHEIQRELASRTYRLTEVRILDLLIWSQSAAT